jgi:chloride channel 7
MSPNRVLKVFECVCWCVIPGTVFFVLPGLFQCTKPLSEIDAGLVNSYTCPGDIFTENRLASLILNSEINTMTTFFTNIILGKAYFWATFAFFWCYFIPCSTGTGINLSAGLFFPGILFGACIGYWIPLLLNLISNNLLEYNHMISQLPTYALVGCAAAITGYNRYVFSMAVMFMESSQSYITIIPCLVGALFSKFLADRLIIDHDSLAYIFGRTPIVVHRPTMTSKEHDASDVMQAPVIALKQYEEVGTIYNVLSTTPHNGFPILNAQNICVGMIS